MGIFRIAWRKGDVKNIQERVNHVITLLLAAASKCSVEKLNVNVVSLNVYCMESLKIWSEQSVANTPLSSTPPLPVT